MYFSRWEHVALAGLILAIVVGLVFGAYQYGRRSGQQELPVVETAPAGPALVHVAGEVKRPGLVRLAPGERVAQAIEKAGGATPAADLQALNLAEEPLDGTKIVVPARSARPVPAPVPASLAFAPAAPAPPARAPAPGLINLNRADPGELDALPGIGPTLARRICEYRRRLGPAGFRSKEQLLDVAGIGPKKYADIAPLVTL